MKDKTVLITGGTGTLGTELVKRLMPACRKVIIFSRDEFKQSEMRKEIYDENKVLRYYIGDVRDLERLRMAFDGVDVVIHCAALKHVSTGVTDPLEVIKTNIHGAENIINAAIERGVKKVLAVSTDKAVNPINLYGGAKFCADKLFVGANRYSKKDETMFSVIRPGNFFGSRGSVVAYFEELKAGGAGVVPITDIRMTRFFIIVEDAADRVIEAVDLMTGGEIFCPKMEPIGIIDLAELLYPRAKVLIIGAKKGEKIHEELVLLSDAGSVYETDNFYIISDKTFNDRLMPNDFEYKSGPIWGEGEWIKKFLS